jgi:biotin/methionine sulfoxide reductase
MSNRRRTASHWGAYTVEVEDGRIARLEPFEKDGDPSPIGNSVPGAIADGCRILRPMVREGWLRNGPRAGQNARGAEPFVAVEWERALDLVSGELRRVKEHHGNTAIFAGSYGWASAGRFHHCQSQIHRFMNMLGGYTASVNSYSLAAAEVILPRVLGAPWIELQREFTSWPVIAEHGRLVVMLGGMALKNAQMSAGGLGRHTARDWLRRCRDAGVEFVNISPIRSDSAEFVEAEWLAPRPNTDTAIMLGLAHTIVADGAHDRAFLERYCIGFERFRAYLMGETDGQPKDAAWASDISGLPAETIRSLARRMAATRTLVTASWSIQRGDHGEQPFWMAVTLAAILGQIGLPGGGVGFGYASVNSVGNPVRKMTGVKLQQGTNPTKSFIPVARIADMLLNPGGVIDYDGRKVTFPDTRIVYWTGGNPFHHHQDLNRLLAAWQRPETIIVHEPWWTSLARHADIVLPATTPFERNDIGCSPNDNFLLAMEQAIPPVGEARNDYDIFSGLAERLGFGERFTEGRSELEWLRHLYDVFRQSAAQEQVELPDFERFWREGHVEYPAPDAAKIFLSGFRADPEKNRLGTPSGRIEVFSATIDSFGYDDCPGHAAWIEPAEWLGAKAAARFPLHLISNQPATRLHSQWDNGAVSRDAKVAGREPLTMNPEDAGRRGIAEGDVVRVFNDRGACLAGVILSDGVRDGVVQLPTGAWYDPAQPGRPGALERHGNPNVLTLDKGSSKLAQAPIAHSCLVEVEKWRGEAPPVRAFEPPPIVS